MAETTHSLRFKIIFFLWISVLLIGGGALGCAGSMGMSVGSGLGPNLLNAGQATDHDPTPSDSENGNPNDPPSGPPSGGPGASGSGPKGSPGTLTISGGPDHPSGQPTEIAAAPLRACFPHDYSCSIPAHQEFERIISGMIVLPSSSSPTTCQKPMDIPITVTVWEKKWGQEDWNPSQDPKDQVTVNSWGQFWHRLHLETNNYACNRTVKYKASYEVQGSLITLESPEYECSNLPLEQSLPAISKCPSDPPEGENPEDRVPPWKKGRLGDEENAPPRWNENPSP